jgi:hypothetical protein
MARGLEGIPRIEGGWWCHTDARAPLNAPVPRSSHRSLLLGRLSRGRSPEFTAHVFVSVFRALLLPRCGTGQGHFNSSWSGHGLPSREDDEGGLRLPSPYFALSWDSQRLIGISARLSGPWCGPSLRTVAVEKGEGGGERREGRRTRRNGVNAAAIAAPLLLGLPAPPAVPPIAGQWEGHTARCVFSGAFASVRPMQRRLLNGYGISSRG